MNRIDQHAGIGASCVGDDPRRLLQILDVGPRHRLEVHGQAEWCAKFAQRRKSLRQAGFFGIVAGDKHVPRSEPRARFQRSTIVLDAGVRFEAEDFDVEDCDARVGKTPLDFAHQRRIANDRPRGLALGCGDKAQADARVSRVSRARHHLGG
jgi:hypothetical protein